MKNTGTFPSPALLLLVAGISFAGCELVEQPPIPSTEPSNPTVAVKWAAYETLSFDSEDFVYSLGEQILFKTDELAGSTDWTWYEDGVKTGTGREYSTSFAETGFHRVSLTLMYNGVFYSGTVVVKISD